jgi:putative Holliday junction resolvase
VTEGKLLGVDHGLKRIGLAVCDESRLVARELTIIKRKSRKEDFEKINRVAAQEGVVGIIVGYPTNVNTNPDSHTQADTVYLLDVFLRQQNCPSCCGMNTFPVRTQKN